MLRKHNWDGTLLCICKVMYAVATVLQMSHTETAVCRNCRPPGLSTTNNIFDSFGRKIFDCQLSRSPIRIRTMVDAWLFGWVALNFRSNEWQTCDQIHLKKFLVEERERDWSNDAWSVYGTLAQYIDDNSHAKAGVDPYVLFEVWNQLA